MTEIKGEKISLVFANKTDKKLIYDLLVSPETNEFMFSEQYPAPTWIEFNEDEPDSFFRGGPSKDGSYLLIKYNDQIIGSISYSCEYSKIANCELDIWIGSTQFTGKGLGIEAIRLLMDYVHSEFSINTFIIRPWAKNINAIKAYKKCGFVEDKSFNAEDYYSEDSLEKYGEGDYGIEDTVNLVMIYQ